MKQKRWIATALVLCPLLTLLPTNVFAGGDVEELKLGDTRTFEAASEDTAPYHDFLFTPEESGTYLWYSSVELYSCGFYDGSFGVYPAYGGASVDHGEIGLSGFSGIWAKLEAGQEYLFHSVLYKSEGRDAGPITFCLEAAPAIEFAELADFIFGTSNGYVGENFIIDSCNFVSCEPALSFYTSKLTMTSSDDEIAAVIQQGRWFTISLNAPGTVTITATFGDVSWSQAVTVKERPEMTDVYLTHYTTAYVAPDEWHWVSWDTYPDGSDSDFKNLISSAPDIIEVDGERVRYLKAGTATLTLELENGLSDSVTVTVKEKPDISTLQIGQSVTLTLGKREQTVYSITPAESGEYILYASYGELRYADDGTAIFLYFDGTTELYMVGEDGDVSYMPSFTSAGIAGDYAGCLFSLEAGQTYYLNIGYTGSPMAPDTYTGTVGILKPGEVDSVTLNKASYTGCSEDHIWLTYTASPLFSASDKEPVWISSNESVVAIDNSSKSYADLDLLAPGEATITVTVGGVSASCKVTVLADNYTFTEGPVYITDENLDKVVYRVNGELDKFTGVYIDGQLVNPANYTATSGSTVITFHPEYLRTLATDWHTLLIAFEDGCAYGPIIIRALSSPEAPTTPTDPSSPGTGDSTLLVLPLVLMVASALGLEIVLNKKKYI